VLGNKTSGPSLEHFVEALGKMKSPVVFKAISKVHLSKRFIGVSWRESRCCFAPPPFSSAVRPYSLKHTDGSLSASPFP
jgi:hypothetical protein